MKITSLLLIVFDHVLNYANMVIRDQKKGVYGI